MVVLFDLYNTLLVNHPILTKCITSMCLVSFSDILSQLLTRNKKDRIKRNLRFMTWGFFFGVVAHFYLQLSNYLIPGKTIGCIIAKLIIDQFIWSPIANALFYFTISFLENPRAQPHEGIASIKKNLWTTTKINVILWVPIQTLNFLFVPVNYQLMVINLVNLFWNCYLSIVANRHVSYSKIESDLSDL